MFVSGLPEYALKVYTGDHLGIADRVLVHAAVKSISRGERKKYPTVCTSENVMNHLCCGEVFPSVYMFRDLVLLFARGGLYFSLEVVVANINRLS